jgi:hypothetical protein
MVFSQLWIIITLAGIHIDAGPLKSVAVVPRHPIGGFALQLCRMLLQLGQIIERVRATQFAGVNETHEQIAHTSAVPGLINLDSEVQLGRGGANV